MKKRYELQYLGGNDYWYVSDGDKYNKTLKSKIECATAWSKDDIEYRVVQKLGREVIKVIYPKGK